MVKEKTIGEFAKEKAQEAFNTYIYFKRCNDKELNKRAEILSKHDLYVEKIVSRLALEKLEKLIRDAGNIYNWYRRFKDERQRNYKSNTENKSN